MDSFYLATDSHGYTQIFTDLCKFHSQDLFLNLKGLEQVTILLLYALIVIVAKILLKVVVV